MIEQPETRGLETATKLRKSLKWLVRATVLLYVILLGLGTYVYLSGQNTKTALCKLRADLQVRVDASTKFLAENPDGVPGIPPKFIQEGIDNQQRTIASLSDLNCPPLIVKIKAKVTPEP